MEGSPTSARMGSIDFLKGLIIIAIVGVHLMLSSTGNGEARTMPLALQMAYLGLMSFYIISGYFYRPGNGFRTNMRKRVIQLVVSLVVCAFALPAILYEWLSMFGQTPEPGDLLYGIEHALSLTDVFMLEGNHTYYATCSASMGYYYLWTMVWGFLVFYALADHVLEDKRRFAVTMIVLTAITMVITVYPYKLPFHLHCATISAIFMFIGAYMARYRTVEYIESLHWRSGRYWMVLLGCLAAGVALCFFFNPGTGFDWFRFGDYGPWSVPIYCLEATLIFVVLLYICKFLSMIPVLSAAVRIAGQHTLGTLLLHGTIATMIIAPFFTITNTSWFPSDMTTMQRAVVFLITLVACVLICRYGPSIIRRICGKQSKKSQEP